MSGRFTRLGQAWYFGGGKPAACSTGLGEEGAGGEGVAVEEGGGGEAFAAFELNFGEF